MPALIAIGSAAAPARALELILMRHDDKDVARADFNLSPAGFRRALDQARLIPACFGKPTEIITFVLDPETGKNARSYQSAVPLAVATGAPIRIAVQSVNGSETIGRGLRQRQGEPETRLVLFWEHRRMPELARGLGMTTMAPIAEQDFDQLFVLRYPASGAPPQITTYRQSDLFRLPCFRSARAPWELPAAADAGGTKP